MTRPGAWHRGCASSAPNKRRCISRTESNRCYSGFPRRAALGCLYDLIQVISSALPDTPTARRDTDPEPELSFENLRPTAGQRRSLPGLGSGAVRAGRSSRHRTVRTSASKLSKPCRSLPPQRLRRGDLLAIRETSPIGLLTPAALLESAPRAWRPASVYVRGLDNSCSGPWMIF